MDRTTLRRARWWILGFALLLGVGVALTVSRAQSGTDGPLDSNTTSTLAELRDEVRQATTPPDRSVPSTTIPTTTGPTTAPEPGSP